MPTARPIPDPSPFLACGLIGKPEPPTLAKKIRALDHNLHIVDIEDYGYFFYVAPPYAEVAEGEGMVVIKVGLMRAGSRLLSASTVLDRGLITPLGVQEADIHGNVLLICLTKREPEFCAYRSPLATPQLYYRAEEGNALLSDNLRMMIELLDHPKINCAALPLHFLFRSVPGRKTYVDDVYRLGSGERLTWSDGTPSTELCRDLRALFDGGDYRSVNAQTVGQFYEQLRSVMAVYLGGLTDGSSRPATLLSGGIDSSLLQQTINDFSAPSARPLSFSYALEAPSFAPEIGYAEDASRVFKTKHTSVEVSPKDYPDLLVTAIRTLGQPPHHESVPCVIPVVEHVSADYDEVRYLFCGGAGGTLHGIGKSQDVVRANRYRNWPVPILRLLARILAPIWQSKAYGAGKAAQVLPSLDDLDSPLHPMNAVSMYTDWELTNRCFDPPAVCEALAYRRELERQQLDSPCLIEKMHMVDQVSGVSVASGFWLQLGLASNRKIIFPYLDDAVVSATLAFDPTERFYHANRTKPILKLILESKNLHDIANRPKYGSGFGDDLLDWMRRGVLRDLVRAIERPAFMEQADFERKLEEPDWFTWNMLTLDLFQKCVLQT